MLAPFESWQHTLPPGVTLYEYYGFRKLLYKRSNGILNPLDQKEVILRTPMASRKVGIKNSLFIDAALKQIFKYNSTVTVE
jgi:hypothetical protein